MALVNMQDVVLTASIGRPKIPRVYVGIGDSEINIANVLLWGNFKSCFDSE